MPTQTRHERILMLKRMTYLLIKTLIIGVLVNLTLQHVAGAPLQAGENPVTPYESQTLKQAPANTDLRFSDP